MAGDWLKVRHDLPLDPAVIAIASRLGIDEDEVVGKLIRFWIWGDQQTKSGNAPGVTKTFVDRYVRAPGFADALEEVGWLSVTSRGISIPKFERHISESAKTRALTANRAAALRSKKRNAVSVTVSSLNTLPSSSSSFSSSSLQLPEGMVFEEIREALEEWVQYKKKRREGYKDPAKQLSLLLKEHKTAEQFKAAVSHSIAHNYSGCFSPRGQSNARSTKPGPGQRHPEDAARNDF